jgi:ribosomal protein L37AE/L43A
LCVKTWDFKCCIVMNVLGQSPHWYWRSLPSCCPLWWIFNFSSESNRRKRIHLVFTKLSTKGPEDIETVLVDHKIWYECKICGKRYDSRVYTNNHIRIEHKRPKQHLCSFCGKSFTQKWVMVKHMKVLWTFITFESFIICMSILHMTS